jgi:ketol-acid reductoisomerase
VQRFMLDNRVGNPEMKASRKRQAEHPIEQVGERLRAMMPWIGKNKLVDKSVN